MSETPKTSALWSRVGAMVVTINEPVVLRRECAQIERELRAECDALRAKVARLRAIVRGKIVIQKMWVDDDGSIQWELADAALKEAK